MIDLKTHEQVIVEIERLGDGAISVKARSLSTQRIMFDRLFVAPHCLNKVSINIVLEGLYYGLD